MKDLIKEVALEGAEKFGVVADDSEIVDLVTWCVAELSKRAEAVALDDVYAAWHGAGVDIAGGNWKRFSGMLPKLFTFPPVHDIEAIDNRTAEACAKLVEDKFDFVGNELLVAETLRSGEWRKYK